MREKPRDLERMRHILVHGYYEADDKIVWQTVTNDLPKLRNMLKQNLE